MQQIFQHTKQMNIWLWCNRVDHAGHWPPARPVGVWVFWWHLRGWRGEFQTQTLRIWPSSGFFFFVFSFFSFKKWICFYSWLFLLFQKECSYWNTTAEADCSKYMNIHLGFFDDEAQSVVCLRERTLLIIDYWPFSCQYVICPEVGIIFPLIVLLRCS